MINLFFTLLLFLFTGMQNLKAQNNPSDCSNAFKICELGDYYFSEVGGAGNQENTYLSETSFKETNSIWLEFEADSEGELEFVIVPDHNNDDLDFILYESSGCEFRNPIRIMTSGRIVGNRTANECLGQTGLHRRSRDIKELDGCFDFDDNFLKPVTLKPLKTYFLLINNFNSSDGLTVLFAGDEHLTLKNNCTRKSFASRIDFNIYPNPARDLVSIVSKINIEEPVEIIMFDLSGQVLLRKTFLNMTEEKQIDVSNYVSGEYYFKIVSEKYKGLKSLIKI